MSLARILHTNRIWASATVLTASSTDQAFALSWLRDQVRSRTWRTALGWTVTAGFNDKINFNRGGVKTATITAGTYATAALFAAAVLAALEAADSTPVWAVSYSGSTFKFTISSDIAFVLLFGSGADLATSAGPDLGYAAADTSSGTSQVAGSTAYQSRQWIKVDLGSALAVSVAVAINHNVTASGTIRAQGNASDAWTAPTVNEALTTTLDESPDVSDRPGRLKLLAAEQTLRYWRFLIDDVSNPDGFVDVGVVYLGTYGEPQYPHTINHSKRRADLSTVEKAVRGAHYQSLRPMARVFSMEWKAPDSDRASLEAMFSNTPKGKNFFYMFNKDEPERTFYCYHEQDVPVEALAGKYLWRIVAVLAEAMP